MREEVSEWQDCGRFAVVDDTGAALVDDDMFQVWAARARPVGPRQGDIRIRDGDPVEVIGNARWDDAGDAAALVKADYRERGEALVFDGTPDDPVFIVRLSHDGEPTASSS